MAILLQVSARGETAFSKASLRPIVAVQGLEVDSLELCLVEDKVEQGGNGIGTIAFIPVVTVANHDTQFSFTSSVTDVVISAVADVFTVGGVYGEPTSEWERVMQFAGMIQ